MHAAQCEQENQCDGNLREEDRLPAEELRQDAAGRRAERGTEHTRRHPDPERRLVARFLLREEIECGRHDKGGAESLDATGAD